MAKANKMRDVMNTDLVALDVNQSAADGAKVMRRMNVGGVLVTRDEELAGIVTDRDLVVRCMADGHDATKVRLGQLCSKNLKTLSVNSSIDDALNMMMDNAIRRIPILDGRTPVGVVTLGDLAAAQDSRSALGRITESQTK